MMTKKEDKKTHTKYYKVAGITIEVNSDYPISENTFHPKFKLFEVDGPGDDNVIINHHFSIPEFPKDIFIPENRVYKQFSWDVYKKNSAWYYKFIPSYPTDPNHTLYAVFNDDHSVGRVYTDDIDEKKYWTGRFESLTLFNTDKVLLSKLMSDREGGLLHCNGIRTAEGCLLLTGTSGAGKATLSKILFNNNYDFIGDDVMIINKQDNIFHAHGLWCHGSQPITTSGVYPLKAILFLEHYDENRITLISPPKDRVYPLLSALVKPILSKKSWNHSFDFLESVIKGVPCYCIQFNLSGKIINNIQKIWRP
ncbi:MAG: hypothetical protein KAH62_03880 [Desulfobacula sp.]|nr:hypothetical protein [Desulfobacula sp.]